MLAALLQSMVDAVYAVDADGLVVFANPASLEILGYEDEHELRGRVSHATIHHSRPDGTPFPPEECPLLLPRQTGQPIRVEDDWFVRRDGTFVPVSYSSAPMSVDGRRGAVVVFRDTSERRRLELERRRAAEVSASRARIVQATLAERQRLGRDLHDGAQQRLINVILALQLAAGSAADDHARELLDDAVRETQAAVADLRDLASGLHPSVLTHRGLRAAIASLTARSPVPVVLDVDPQRLPEIVEGTAYFVVAEALANVGKHAHASEASVSVHGDGAWLTIEVTDDGRGGAQTGRGSGLSGLTDRVAAIGGTLTVESPSAGGTRVTVRLPVEPELELESPPPSA